MSINRYIQPGVAQSTLPPPMSILNNIIIQYYFILCQLIILEYLHRGLVSILLGTWGLGTHFIHVRHHTCRRKERKTRRVGGQAWGLDACAHPTDP